MNISIFYQGNTIHIYLLDFREIEFSDFFSNKLIGCMFCADNFHKYSNKQINHMIHSLLHFKCKELFYMGRGGKEILRISDGMIVWNSMKKKSLVAEPIYCFGNEYTNISDIEGDIFNFSRYRYGDNDLLLEKFIFCDNKNMFERVVNYLHKTNYAN